MSNQILHELQKVILRFEGMTCTEVKGGFGVGSKFWLLFGELQTVTVHLQNRDSFSLEDAKAGIDAHCASWRIETPDKIVCSSASVNDISGPMDEGFQLIKGLKLERIHLKGIALDLELEFSGGIRLLIFCDQCRQAEDHDNYEIVWDGRIYTVGSNSVVRRE